MPLGLVDQDLSYGLPDDALDLAQRVAVTVYPMQEGAWSREAGPTDFAYLVLNGIVSREISADDRRVVELVAPGEMLSASVPFAHDSLVHEVGSARWTALTDARVVIISREQMEQLTVAPALALRVLERLDYSTDRLRFSLSLSSISRLADRLHLLLWHYAERWGTRRHGVTYVDLPVRQSTLADLVGANRSSVSVALKELAQSGRAVYSKRRVWTLQETTPNSGMRVFLDSDARGADAYSRAA